jgi:4-hydroxy-tetrahydrodipicolinate reductase
MGRRVIALASSDPAFRLVEALEREGHPQAGKEVGPICGVGALGVSLGKPARPDPQVMIDFSTPQAVRARLAECVERGVSIVVCTTGLGEEERQALARASSRIGVFWSPNMSRGANLLMRLAAEAVCALGEGCDVEIVEMHHRNKTDAPSGTALEILRKIAEARGGADPDRLLRAGRSGRTGARSREEIGVHALRGGDVVGEHTVVLAVEGERLELTHRAHTRDAFAQGALQAARFLCGRAPGLYRMEDLFRNS